MTGDEHWCHSTSPVAKCYGLPTEDGQPIIGHVRHADGSVCINPRFFDQVVISVPKNGAPITYITPPFTLTYD